LARASREYQIKDTVLSRWKAQFLDGAPGIFEAGRPAEEKRLRERIADLERLAGKQALHLEIAKKSQSLLEVATARKRELVQELSREYTVRDCCAVLDLARSSYYHRAEPRDESRLREAIEDIAGRFPRYGSRKIKKQLERAPYRIKVGRHLVRRLMRQMSFLVKPKQRRVKTMDSRHGLRRFPNLVRGVKASRPDQIWVADNTYIRLRSDEIYLAILMDQFSRAIRGWNLSSSLGQELALIPLQYALRHYPAPEIHHSDQGTQYVSKAYVQDVGTQISMAAVGKPSENGYAEREIRTIKEEEVYLSDYANMADARQQIGNFIDVVYWHKRLHSALDYQTPAEVEARWQLNPPSTS
jgi:transposase InsO family protein